MADRWGYRLPDRPTDKGVRAAHRYHAKYAALTDLSFYQHFDIRGKEKDLIKLFENVTSKDVGPSVGALRYTKGVMRGNLVLYRPGCYPTNVIGSLDFIWKPETANESERTLWLWCHPLSSCQAWEALRAANAEQDLGCALRWIP
jgi:ribonuclease P/MRP protein subunit POP1